MNPGFSQKEWEYRQRTLPPLVFDQEHNAQFVDATGGLLKRSEVKYAELPKREDLVTVVFGIDPAVSERSSADRTALCVAAVDPQDRRFVAALYAWRLDWPTSMQKIIGLFEAWRPNIVVVEEVSFQKLVVQQLADFMPVKPIRPEADKITRWEAIHTYYHCGEIYHATNLDVECENEIFGFPVANHDDVIDATTYALAELFTVVKRARVGRNDVPGFFRDKLPHERSAKLVYDKWGNLWSDDAFDEDRQIIELGSYIEPYDVGYLAPGLLEKTFPVGCIPGARMPIERPASS
jgi:predicted phage terminase large subunit-like protein